MVSVSASLRIALERCDNAIDGIGAGFFFGFTFGQRFRNFRKPHEPPAPRRWGPISLFAVLQRREPVVVIESPVTTSAGATIKGHSHSAVATEPSDFSLEFVSRHVAKSHRYVRISRPRHRDSNRDEAAKFKLQQS